MGIIIGVVVVSIVVIAAVVIVIYCIRSRGTSGDGGKENGAKDAPGSSAEIVDDHFEIKSSTNKDKIESEIMSDYVPSESLGDSAGTSVNLN